MQPALLALDGRAGGLLVLVVALEDVRALQQDLPVVADPDLDPDHRLAHGAEAELVALGWLTVALVAVSVIP